jgi:ABC-type polysaccharide/polyol phosphate transport system ATPase subunit
MPIIEVNHVTKEYQLGHITSFKENVANSYRRLIGKPIHKREDFKALDDVSFSIEQGEVVGIIGHNGAGKSTLLKHLANISKPTKGNVIVRGSIAPLIEVGAGVNPELTGRENIYLNGAILGIPKKIIQQKFEEIIEFSELEQFIDTPVKRYSSGMTVKLGFSIATSLDADILIVDEVLAVGDLAFQRKCFDRMEDMIKRQGKTVLLVSHNIRQIERLCPRTIMLDHGKILKDSDSTTVCNEFYSVSNAKIQDAHDCFHTHNYESCNEFKLNSIDVIDNNCNLTNSIISRSQLNIRVRFTLFKAFRKPEIVIGTHTTDFVYLTASSTVTFDDRPDFEIGDHEVIYTTNSFPLIEGVYAIRFSMFDENRGQIFTGESLKIFNVREPAGKRSESGWLTLNLPTTWTLKNKEYCAKAFSRA